MRLVLILALIAVGIVALVMILRPSEPRVTTIEHRREDNDGDDDA